MESEPPDERNIRCIDRRISWQSVPAATFAGEDKRIDDFDRLTRIICAAAAIKPTADGLGLDGNVSDGMTIRSALAPSRDIPMVAELLALDETLVQKKARIGEADLKKKIESILSSISSGSKRNLAGFDPAKFSGIHREAATRSAQWRADADKCLQETLAGISNLDLKPNSPSSPRGRNDRKK